MNNDELIVMHLFTGTAWLRTLVAEGTLCDSPLAVLDRCYEETGDIPATRLTYDEVEEYMLTDTALPINGGEFHIEGVSYVEPMDEFLKHKDESTKEYVKGKIDELLEKEEPIYFEVKWSEVG